MVVEDSYTPCGMLDSLNWLGYKHDGNSDRNDCLRPIDLHTIKSG
jgi:hypothetical protein